MVVGYFRFSPCAFHCWISPSIGIDCVSRTVCDIFSVIAILIRRRHLQLGALAFDAACFCVFDAAGFCIFSFDPPSLESLLLTLAALFRICAHRLDVFAWWHLASPSTSPFIPIEFRIAVAFRFAFDMFTFVSYFRRFGFHAFPSHSIPSPTAMFRIVALSTSGCAWYHFAFCIFGSVHSPAMSLALFCYSSPGVFQDTLSRSIRTIAFRRQVSYRIVRPSMSSASLNQYLSLYLVARSCALREGE
jgi:hypothetical protein